MHPSPALAQSSAAHNWFSSRLPELLSRCRAATHHLPVAEREEAQAEVIAQAFQYCVSAERRGRLGRLTPFTLVSFFTRAYRAGRRVAGTAPGDVLSDAGRLRHHRRIRSLQEDRPDRRGRERRRLSLADTLADRRADRPLENVRRNLDYVSILESERASRKIRRVFDYLCETAAEGPQTVLAAELGVSQPRVCQFKNALADMLAAHGYAPVTRDPSPTPPKKRGRRPRGLATRLIPLNAGTSPGRQLQAA